MDPVTDLFKTTLRRLEEYDKLCSLLSRVRRVDETNSATLERLIDERHDLVTLCHALKIEHSPFDSSFKESGNIVKKLRTKLSVVCFSLLPDG